MLRNFNMVCILRDVNKIDPNLTFRSSRTPSVCQYKHQSLVLIVSINLLIKQLHKIIFLFAVIHSQYFLSVFTCNCNFYLQNCDTYIFQSKVHCYADIHVIRHHVSSASALSKYCIRVFT